MLPLNDGNQLLVVGEGGRSRGCGYAAAVRTCVRSVSVSLIVSCLSPVLGFAYGVERGGFFIRVEIPRAVDVLDRASHRLRNPAADDSIQVGRDKASAGHDRETRLFRLAAGILGWGPRATLQGAKPPLPPRGPECHGPTSNLPRPSPAPKSPFCVAFPLGARVQAARILKRWHRDKTNRPSALPPSRLTALPPLRNDL